MIVGWPTSVPLALRLPFGGDERADLGERPRVEHVARLDPAAPRGADADPHLPVEQPRPVAVAVDRQRHARRDRRARVLAVEVEMRRRAVDLERRAGLGSGREDCLEVQRYPRPARRAGWPGA